MNMPGISSYYAIARARQKHVVAEMPYTHTNNLLLKQEASR